MKVFNKKNYILMMKNIQLANKYIRYNYKQMKKDSFHHKNVED